MPESEARQGGGSAAVRRTRAVLPWLLLVAALGWGLGSYPLVEPDEGRNAEVGREMAASGDFAVPRLDGLPYLDKPVAYFAADALAQRLFGANEAAARLPSLLCALATALLTGWFARRVLAPPPAGGGGARGGGASAMGGPAGPVTARVGSGVSDEVVTVGWVAALAALVTPLPIAFARSVIFDSMLAFFITVSLCAFWLAIETRAAQRSEPAHPESDRGAYLPWTLLAWAAIGAGILTKGPVALAVPLLAAAPFAIYRRASRAVWHPLGAVAMAVVVGPWIAWMSHVVPEFLHYALVIETWQRVATPALNREGPLWLYVPVLIAGTLPWSIVVIAGWRRSLRLRTPAGAGRVDPAGGADPADRAARARRLDPLLLYLFLWVGVPFVMFSLSHSKRAQYILPLLPAVAVLAAKVWRDAAPRLPGRRATLTTWAALGLACAIAIPCVAASHAPSLAHLTRLTPTLAALAVAFVTGAVLLFAAGRAPGRSRSEIALLVLGLVLPMALLPAISVPLMAEIGGHRSARDAAAAIIARLPSEGTVIGIHSYPPSLPFYLRRPVLVASQHGRELTSNYVIAYFQKWLAAPPAQTPLRSSDAWRGLLAECTPAAVFVTWADDATDRATLAAHGLPLLAANDRLAAYGPCTPPSPPP